MSDRPPWWRRTTNIGGSEMELTETEQRLLNDAERSLGLEWYHRTLGHMDDDDDEEDLFTQPAPQPTPPPGELPGRPIHIDDDDDEQPSSTQPAPQPTDTSACTRIPGCTCVQCEEPRWPTQPPPMEPAPVAPLSIDPPQLRQIEPGILGPGRTMPLIDFLVERRGVHDVDGQPVFAQPTLDERIAFEQSLTQPMPIEPTPEEPTPPEPTPLEIPEPDEEKLDKTTLIDKWLPVFQTHIRNYPRNNTQLFNRSSWFVEAMDLIIESSKECRKSGYSIGAYKVKPGDYTMETDKPWTMQFHGNLALTIRQFVSLTERVIYGVQQWEGLMKEQDASFEMPQDWKALIEKRKRARALGQWRTQFPAHGSSQPPPPWSQEAAAAREAQPSREANDRR